MNMRVGAGGAQLANRGAARQNTENTESGGNREGGGKTEERKPESDGSAREPGGAGRTPGFGEVVPAFVNLPDSQAALASHPADTRAAGSSVDATTSPFSAAEPHVNRLVENPDAPNPSREAEATDDAEEDLHDYLVSAKTALEILDDDVSAGSDDVDQQARMTDAVLEETRNKIDSAAYVMREVSDELAEARQAKRKLDPGEIEELQELSKQFTKTMGNLSEYAMLETLRFTRSVGENAAAENKAASAAKAAKDWAIVGAVFGAAAGAVTGQPLAAAIGSGSGIVKAATDSTLAVGSAVRSGAAAAMETAPGKTSVVDISDQEMEDAERLFDDLKNINAEFKATANFNGGNAIEGVVDRIQAGGVHMSESYTGAAEETMAVSLLQNLHQRGTGHANSIVEQTAEDGTIEKGTNLAFVRRALEDLGYHTLGGGASDYIYGDYDDDEAALLSFAGGDRDTINEVLGEPLWTSTRAGSGRDDTDLLVYNDDTLAGRDGSEPYKYAGLSVWTEKTGVGYADDLEHIDDPLEDVDLEEHVRQLRSGFWETAWFRAQHDWDV